MGDVHVEICMGSSCHSRGNFELARLLTSIGEEDPRIRVVGALCRNRCSEGPVVTVNGQLVLQPDAPTLREMIARALEADEAAQSRDRGA